MIAIIVRILLDLNLDKNGFLCFAQAEPLLCYKYANKLFYFINIYFKSATSTLLLCV